jgi:hypothetical protein
MNRTWILRLMSGAAIASILPLGYALPTPAQQAPGDPTAAPLPLPVTTTTQTCRRRLVRGQCLRLRATFFEEERRLRYGFTDFLEAALDGASNSINSSIRNPNFLNLDPSVEANPDELRGSLTLESRDPNDDNFLVGNFNPPGAGALNITNVTRDSGRPQTGQVSINGTIQVQNPDGSTRPITVNIVNGRYRASGSQRGDLFSGTIEITDPNNPNQVVLIQVPRTDLNGVEDDSTLITRPANLSIGRPVDR